MRREMGPLSSTVSTDAKVMNASTTVVRGSDRPSHYVGILASAGGLEAIDPLAKAAVFSGYSSDPVLRDFRRYGFVQALQKPLRVDEFNRFISQVIQASEASDAEN